MTDCAFLKKMRWKPDQQIFVSFPPDGLMEQIDVPATSGRTRFPEKQFLIFAVNYINMNYFTECSVVFEFPFADLM